MKPIEGKPRTAIIGGLLILLACLMVMTWAGQGLTRISGAGKLAADAQGNIWLSLNGDLLQLSPDGEVRKEFDQTSLGVGKISAIVPMPGGKLWLGSLSHERLYLFSAEGKKLAEASPPASAEPIFGTFHAAYEPQSDRLVVADTQNHRLLAFTGTGQYVDDSKSTLDLRFPNALAANGHGDLLLADTNHHIMKSVKPDLSAANDTPIKPQSITIDGRQHRYTWPVSVSLAPGGARYVSWHGPDLLRGNVLAYAANGEFLHALKLGSQAEPQSLLARADDVLVAVKSGETLELLRFGQQGQALGSFGDDAVQARLSAASSRADMLRLLQRASRALLLACALGLLIVALRIRRQHEHAESKDILQLQADPDGVSTRVLVGVVFGMSALTLMLLYGAVAATQIARDSHSPSLMALARWEIPVLAGFLYLGMIAVWRSSRLFLALQMHMTKRRLRRWLPYLPTMLHPDEQVEDFGVAPSLWRGRLLIASNRRLLMLGMAGASREPLWQAPWESLSAPRVEPQPWWLRFVNPRGAIVTLDGHGTSKPLRIHAFSRWHIDQLEALCASARARFAARPPAPMSTRNASAQIAATPRSPWRGALLSLLLPGLGQMDQGRPRYGTSLMLIALSIAGIGVVSWIVYLGRFSDQAMWAPITLAAVYIATCLYSAWDAVRYARQAITLLRS